MHLELNDDQRLVLDYLREGLDPFTGCKARGDCGARLLVLASLRRLGLIDHHDRLVPAAAAHGGSSNITANRGLAIGSVH
jgi:hypothetical protein